MKKIQLLTLTALLLIGGASNGHAQFSVTAPLLEALTSWSHLENVIYYAQMVEQQVQSAVNTYNQFQNMVRSEQRALENLRGITQIRSFSDFMGFYNRQLNLEYEAENRMQNMSITIGNNPKPYKLKDIASMASATRTEYVDYWDAQFTPEQRKKMWIDMGMTPANYAYVQTWKAKEQEIANILGTNIDILNEENNSSLETMDQLRQKIYDPSVAEKGALQAIFEVMVDQNATMHQMQLDRARRDAYDMARDAQNNAPGNDVTVSDWWNQPIFYPITDNDY